MRADEPQIANRLADCKPASNRCPYCGSLMGGYGQPHSRSRDHIVPRAWGGPNRSDNIRIVCARCNLLRGEAGHCIGALACAHAVAGDWRATEWVLRRWRLRRPAAPALWFRVNFPSVAYR